MAGLGDRIRLPRRRKRAFHSGCFLLTSSLTGAVRADKAQTPQSLLTRLGFWVSLGSGMAHLRPGRESMTEAEAPLVASTPPSEAAIAAEPSQARVADGGRRRSGRRWLIIGGIALVFLLLIGYVLGGPAAAGGPIARADSALHTAVSHNNETVDSFNNDPFNGIDFSSNAVDIAAVKAAVATDKQKVAKWQAQVSSDRAALQQVRPDLKRSLLTLPEQGTVDRHRQRVEAALSALSTAQKGIDLTMKEFAFFDPFVDAMAGFEAIGKAGTANDLAGVKAQLPATVANTKTTTPRRMAASARLKSVGHRWTSMKSMTLPRRTRSIRLLVAPPATAPRATAPAVPGAPRTTTTATATTTRTETTRKTRLWPRSRPRPAPELLVRRNHSQPAMTVISWAGRSEPSA